MQVLFDTLDAQGRSIRWLARQLGVDRTLLSHYKSGRRAMPEEMARRAAALLGIPETLVIPVSPAAHTLIEAPA